jgi:hypothetical protein
MSVISFLSCFEKELPVRWNKKRMKERQKEEGKDYGNTLKRNTQKGGLH